MTNVKSKKLSASLEDYLEAIFNLSGDTKLARSKDIAELLDVSKASVTGALRTLKSKGLVNYQPYGQITLTKQGDKAAADVAQKHNILKSFFINVLDVDKDIAQNAACKAEHALGPKIINKLLCFIEFAVSKNKKGDNIASEFKKFCKIR